MVNRIRGISVRLCTLYMMHRNFTASIPKSDTGASPGRLPSKAVNSDASTRQAFERAVGIVASKCRLWTRLGKSNRGVQDTILPSYRFGDTTTSSSIASRDGPGISVATSG